MRKMSSNSQKQRIHVKSKLFKMHKVTTKNSRQSNDSRPDDRTAFGLTRWNGTRQTETQTIYTQGEQVNTIRVEKTNQTREGQAD